MKNLCCNNDHYKTLIRLVFFVAIILRIGLSIVNREANDDHFAVIKKIENEGKLPILTDCWECFHPKLYHSFVATILKVHPFKSFREQIMLAQFLNCIAGIITIYIVWLFLSNRAVTDKIKFICFSMVALNPKLISINAQATNDSFVILFSTAALYFTYHFFVTKRFKNFLGMTIFTVLAGLSKGNGLVLFPGILIIFIFKLLKTKNFSLTLKKGYLLYLLIFSFVSLTLIPSFGQYWYNYRHFGSPFVINQNKDPFPLFFKNTYYKRPGVTSILSSYFTFRFFDLIAHPTVTNDAKIYPLHRTSLWSQLYGRTHFVYFDMWPPSWQTKNEIILNIGRFIFILALIPSFVLLLGIIKKVSVWVIAVIKYKFDFIENSNDWVFDIFFIAYTSFIIVLTLMHREFSFMKAIYLFPGILPVVYLFLEGMGCLSRIYDKNIKFRLCFDSIFGLLFFSYFLISISLIYKLSGWIVLA